MTLWIPPSDWVQLCPNSPMHRTLDDGRVEVSGYGTPGYDKDPTGTTLRRVWKQWGYLLSAKARKYKIPVPWLLATMVIETGGRPGLVSPAGALGMMGIMPQTAQHYLGRPLYPDELSTDHDLDVDISAQVLRDHKRRFNNDWPSIASAYNAGGVYCSDVGSYGVREDQGSRYAWRAIGLNNDARQMLGLFDDSGGGWSAEALSAYAKTGMVVLTGVALGYAVVANQDRVFAWFEELID